MEGRIPAEADDVAWYRQGVLAAVVFVAAAQAGAEPARQAYKHVDEQGRVTYSQTPPAKDAKKMALTPPRSTPPPGRDYEREALRRQEYEEQRSRYERAHRERQAALEAERNKRIEALRAECHRNRGTDCNDPETVRRMEAERTPGQHRPIARGAR
jgi:hypothetical protein